jgi:hypothetical protein
MKKPLFPILIAFYFVTFFASFPINTRASDLSTLSEENESKLQILLSQALDQASGGVFNRPPTGAAITFEPVKLELPQNEFKGRDILLARFTTLNGGLRALALISTDGEAVKILYYTYEQQK